MTTNPLIRRRNRPGSYFCTKEGGEATVSDPDTEVVTSRQVEGTESEANSANMAGAHGTRETSIDENTSPTQIRVQIQTRNVYTQMSMEARHVTVAVHDCKCISIVIGQRSRMLNSRACSRATTTIPAMYDDRTHPEDIR